MTGLMQWQCSGDQRQGEWRIRAYGYTDIRTYAHVSRYSTPAVESFPTDRPQVRHCRDVEDVGRSLILTGCGNQLNQHA